SGFLGDRVSVASFGGPGVPNIRVRLFLDSNRDQSRNGEQLLATTFTDGSGAYGFPGLAAECYVVNFSEFTDGLGIDGDQRNQSVCLDAGAANGRIDVVAEVVPPDGCLVEQAGERYWLGVEVYQLSDKRAQSYTFYGSNGELILRTKRFGPPDDIDGAGDYEWFGAFNGFNHRDVYAVAAEYAGLESPPVVCARD
ncbi:MAG: hypothetical protein AAF547_20355, partial [Actinomycetota bacterium]